MLTAMRDGEMRTCWATSSVRAVKEALRRVETGDVPCEAAGDVAIHLEVLAGRVYRLNRLGGAFAGVRLSPCVESLRAASEANPNGD
jgi:hypothetical protein